MKNIVGKIKRYKYFFCIMLLIITQVFVCVELNKKQIETVSSYARHNCYAYSIKNINENVKRFSDDGEPSGTAGAPILNIIEKNDVFQKISLQDGDKLSQKIWINSLSINQLQMIIQTVQGDSFIDVSLKDEKGKYKVVDLSNSDLEKIHGVYNYEND